MLRGLYDLRDEADPDFREVKTFATAAESEAWCARVKTACTNPDYPHCHHIYTTLCDWNQVKKYLIEPLERLRTVPSSEARASAAGVSSGRSESSSGSGDDVVPPSNVFSGEPTIRASLRACLDLPHHVHTNEESTLNTLRYLFFHMKCGIFVAIKNNRVAMFVPFVNKDYRNTWAERLQLEGGSVGGYEDLKYEAQCLWAEAETHRDGKRRRVRREAYLTDTGRWWANGNIICNVESEDYWGDSYLPQLRHMLETLCASRTVPDCEFFINKRDFPHLKRNLTEPYDFLFDADDTPLVRERYTSYAPIMSFFVGKDFADVPFVTTDDWETATGRVFPPHNIDVRSALNRQQNEVPWAEREPTAFFRGNSTGPGIDAGTNQRIRLAALCQTWATDPAAKARTGAGNPVDGKPYLDAGLVGFNMRDRKLQGRPMTFQRPAALGIPPAPRVPMFKQMAFKYHVYVEGHCAAMRYASMMPLGAVILKVASTTKADQMWYFPLLRPYDFRSACPDPAGDHLPVASDLSDLEEVITWCKTHDKECEAIASNSKALYGRLIALEGQLDYLQLVLAEVAARFKSNRSGARSSAEEDAVAGWDTSAFRAQPFAPSHDWFAATNTEYLEVDRVGKEAVPPPLPSSGIGTLPPVCHASNVAPPVVPELANASCACSHCSALPPLPPPSFASGPRALGPQLGSSRGLGGTLLSLAAASSSGSAPASGSASESSKAAAAPKVAIAAASAALTDSDRLRAALAARAAMAKSRGAGT